MNRSCRPRSRTVLRSVLVSLLMIVTVTIGWPANAGAHSGDQSYIYVDLLSDRMEGRVEYLVADLNRELGLDIADDEELAPDQLEEQRAVIEAFTREHFALEFPDGAPDLTFDEIEYLELSAGSYVVYHFTTGDLGGEPPRDFSVTYDGFLEGSPDATALLIIGRDWDNGVIANEADHLRVFDADNTNFDVALDEGSWLTGMRGIIGLGLEHIRTGADHVMFILTLLLPSVLLAGRGAGSGGGSGSRAGGLAALTGDRQPVATFGSSLMRVVKVATAFTVAHSITLSLAAFEVVNINSKVVESIIAISIALAALHNIRPVFANREWLLAFGFGLFHGLGFAGLLGEIGLARDQQFWTLLGFNIGVELGQVAIILALFPTLFLLRRTRFYVPLMVAASIGLILVALGWAAERVLELNLRIDDLFDPVLYYPRVVVLLVIAALVAAGVYFAEKRRERLIPIFD